MTHSTINILSILVFLGLICQGYSQCSLDDIVVKEYLPGQRVEGKPEWFVTITSKCSCAQSLTLNCEGFQSVIPVDPSILKVSGSNCLVKGGGRIDTTPITFKYAWSDYFELNPIHVEPCS